MDREQYLKLIDTAINTVATKHQDYGNNSLGLRSYFPFGEASYVQMIFVKAQRLVSLVQHDPDEVINHESMKDNVLDLINYCVFLLDYLGDVNEL